MSSSTPLNTTTRVPLTFTAGDEATATTPNALPMGGRRFRVSFTSEVAGMSFYTIPETLIEGDTFAELALACRATYGVQSATLHSVGVDLSFIAGFEPEITPTNLATTTVQETTEGVDCNDKISAFIVVDFDKAVVSHVEGDLTFATQPPYAAKVVTVSLVDGAELGIEVSGTSLVITQESGVTTAQEIADLINNDPVAGNIVDVNVTGVSYNTQNTFLAFALVPDTTSAYTFRIWAMQGNTWYIKLPLDLSGTAALPVPMSFPLDVANVDRLYIQISLVTGTATAQAKIGLYNNG